MGTRTYRITDWRRLFENNRTRELKRMDWVPVPNKMDGLGYTELVEHANGAAHLGAWLAIIEIASRRDERGSLPGEGADVPIALARISRLPVNIFEEVLPRLLKIGWIQAIQCVIEIPQEGAGIPHLPAAIPHDAATFPQEGAGSRTRAVEERTEGKSTEQNGMGGAGSRPLAAVPKSPPLLDDYGSFVEAVYFAELPASEVDLTDAKFEWKVLDFNAKTAAVKGLRDRVAAGEYQEVKFRPLPKNYLKKRMWQRPIRAAPIILSKTDRAEVILLENLAAKAQLVGGRK